MNKADIFQDISLHYRMWPSSLPMNRPSLSILTWLSLFGYLITLAITQTIYNQPFMTARWVMLGLLATSCAADIILVTTRSGYQKGISNTTILAVYLLITFSTVIYAENWLFSGMRWASHAMMLIILVAILPQIIAIRQILLFLNVLKYLMAALVVISWLFPAPTTIVDVNTMYKGVMGNANTMGHIAFIAAILFLQNALTSKTTGIRYLSGAFALASAITIWHSGARSSMIAFFIGLLLLLYYYRKQVKVFVLIGMFLGSLVMVSFPKMPEEIIKFAQKSQETGALDSFNPTHSRVSVWSASYEGFKKRPLFGWGFGADSTIPKKWEIKFTALGTVERDAVNDFLFMLEGCGIVGMGAYLLLIFIVLKQRPSRLQSSILKSFSLNHETNPDALALHHAHIAFFILPTCLLVLNQFDNSALSAGNLISVTLWFCVGCAAVLRRVIS